MAVFALFIEAGSDVYDANAAEVQDEMDIVYTTSTRSLMLNIEFLD